MKQELKDKEVILCAAIHYDNGLEYPHQSIYGVKTGFVLCGYRHPNIIGILLLISILKRLMKIVYR